jgi:hypothetical protein
MESASTNVKPRSLPKAKRQDAAVYPMLSCGPFMLKYHHNS